MTVVVKHTPVLYDRSFLLLASQKSVSCLTLLFRCSGKRVVDVVDVVNVIDVDIDDVDGDAQRSTVEGKWVIYE